MPLSDLGLELADMNVIARKIANLEGVEVLLAPTLISRNEMRVEMRVVKDGIPYVIVIRTAKGSNCTLLNVTDLYEKYDLPLDLLGWLVAIAQAWYEWSKLVVCGNTIGVMLGNKYVVAVHREVELNIPQVQIPWLKRVYLNVN